MSRPSADSVRLTNMLAEVDKMLAEAVRARDDATRRIADLTVIQNHLAGAPQPPARAPRKRKAPDLLAPRGEAGAAE